MEEITIHIKNLEELGYSIPNTTNSKILYTFYATQGVTEDTSFNEWIQSIAEGKLAPYCSVMEAIRENRKNNTKWEKRQ